MVFNVARTGKTSAEISRGLAERNVLINGIDAENMRLVTHMDVDRAAWGRALEALRPVCG